MLSISRVKVAFIAIALSGTAALGAIAVSGVLGGAGAAAGGPSVGRIPNSAFAGGHLNAALVPAYVPALNQQGSVVGYVRKVDILPPSQDANGFITGPAPASTGPVPVYASTLSKVVGHMVPGVGFVPLGESQSSQVHMPVTVTTTPPQGT
jgi:hypothetical protein